MKVWCSLSHVTLLKLCLILFFFVRFCLVCHWGLFVAQFFFSSSFFSTCYLLQSLKEISCIYISVRRNDFPCPSGKILIQVHVDCRFSIWISWVLLTGPRHSAVCHRSGEGTRMDRKQKQLALFKKKNPWSALKVFHKAHVTLQKM